MIFWKPTRLIIHSDKVNEFIKFNRHEQHCALYMKKDYGSRNKQMILTANSMGKKERERCKLSS